jgi:tetratricopeptide (TPR) repeat protein
VGSREDQILVLQAALERRMERFSRGDEDAVLDTRAVDEARELAALLRGNVADVRSLLVLGWVHWSRYQVLPRGRDKEDLAAAVTMLTPCFMSGAEALPKPLLPALADAALPEATSLLSQATSSSDSALISFTTGLWRRIAANTPAGHPDRLARLSDLGVLLSVRYHDSASAGDLDEAITIGRQLVHLSTAGTSQWAMYQANLAVDLHSRYTATGSLKDLDGAIEAWRASVSGAHVDPSRRVRRLNDLGVALSHRHSRTQNAADLEEAIQIDHQVLEMDGPDSANLAKNLANLGVDLRAKYMHTTANADLDEAIRVFRAAVEALPDGEPGKPERMSDLSVLLSRTGEPADLAESARIGRAAVEASLQGHQGRGGVLANLCGVLESWYEHSGRNEDLDEALRTARDGLRHVPDDDPGRAAVAAALGVILSERADRTGSIADLNEAVEASRYAATLAPADDPHRPDNVSRAEFWLRFCADLMRRYERTAGGLSQIDEAVAAGEEAVKAAPPGHRSRPGALNNLSTALHVRYLRTGRQDDLDGAIRAILEALDASTPDAAPDTTFLMNMAYMLRSRYLRTHDADTINASIDAARSALQSMAPDNPERAGCMQNLAISLTARWRQHQGRREDLDEAIMLEREASAITPPDDPSLQRTLINLGTALSNRWQITDSAEDYKDAVDANVRAGELSLVPPSIRVEAKRTAARLAASSDPHKAAGLLAEAVHLLPEVAPREQERQDQQHSLASFSGLVTTAAALALSAGKDHSASAEAALELLETGRAVMMSQALETRSDLSDLAARHPALAAQYGELRDRLDRPDGNPGIRATKPPAGEGNATRPLGDTFRDRAQVADEFRRIISEIRKQQGFQSFMLPPTADELARQAAAGPLVVINASPDRSDAIIVRTSGTAAVSLPELQDGLVSQISALRSGARAAQDADTMQERRAGQDAIFSVLEWLWDALAAPVLSELGWDDDLSAHPGRRLWWAPGGLLGMLPVHAAGYHREAARGSRRTVMDRAVSSYTPTVRALRYARERTVATAGDGLLKGLVITMAETPGANPLSGTWDEAQLVRDLLSSAAAEVTVLKDDLATTARVLGRIDQSAIVHFGCHGLNDALDPSQSSLLLHDHQSNPLTIETLSSIRLSKAQLAYLSACDTAIQGSLDLIDEFIQLSTAFQLLGFPHVVGTLWEIMDDFAAEAARDFYSQLVTEDGGIDTSRAAQALHYATLNARSRAPGAPSLWAAYTHAGA